MKTSLLKIYSIFLICLLILSCNSDTKKKSGEEDDKTISLAASQQLPSPGDGSENKTWKFCELDCAVDCSLYYIYNTKEGSAFFYIPIPEKATLSNYKISQDGKSVSFKCTNSIHDAKLINKKIEIPSGLAKNKGEVLHISVVFEDYDCKNPELKATKNKGSVLQGHPFDEPRKEACICL